MAKPKASQNCTPKKEISPSETALKPKPPSQPNDLITEDEQQQQQQQQHQQQQPNELITEDEQQQPNDLPEADQKRDIKSLLNVPIATILAVALFAISFFMQLVVYENHLILSNGDASNGNALIVANDIEIGYFGNVIERLERVGNKIEFLDKPQDFNRIYMDRLQQYDTIWFYDNPFVKGNIFRPNQRINHFPGSNFITDKMSLFQGKDNPNKLVSFLLPNDKQEFIEYTLENPDKLWIIKADSHSSISVRNAQDINTLRYFPIGGIIVQEYLQNPYLIDGRKFDIGIYSLLTSLEPLRVYIFNEVLARFCSNPYNDPETGGINLADRDSYIIANNYTPIWEIESMRLFQDSNMGTKRSLNQYWKQQGQDPSKLWKQIETTIMKVYKSKEYYMSRQMNDVFKSQNINSFSVRGSLNQFFELVRFDFIVDQNLNAHLMEANVSPNLSSTQYPPNDILDGQVLNSLFNLVGLNKFTKGKTGKLPIHYIDGTLELPEDEQEIYDQEKSRYGLDEIIANHELSVNEDVCLADECHLDCEQLNCKTCYLCLDYANKLHIRRAIYEHKNRWNFQRILPTTNPNDLPPSSVLIRRKTIDANWLHTEWFKAKCKIDITYCSP